MSEGWINGGFFVLEQGIFDYIPGDVDWAREPLESLAAAGQLSGYCHAGFWQCMDTMRDKQLLNRAVGQRRSALEALGLVTTDVVRRRRRSPGSCCSRRRPIADDRGWFSRTLDLAWLDDAGLETPFVHHNQSRSRRGVLRGLHVRGGQGEVKLVRCARGAIVDHVVDTRPWSPTFRPRRARSCSTTSPSTTSTSRRSSPTGSR